MKILHYLKRFIMFVIKEIFSFFIKLFLFLFIVGIIISAVIKSFEEKPTVAIKNKAYVLRWFYKFLYFITKYRNYFLWW